MTDPALDRAAPPPSAAPEARLGPLAGLAILPVTLAVGFSVLPSVRVGESAADAGAAAFTATAVIASLAVSSRAVLPFRARILLGSLAISALLVIAVRGGVSVAAVIGVALALVMIGWAVGDGIGRRIAHPGHLAPACAVAGGADLLSVLSPEGPSRAIAESEAAQSALVVAGPVPGHAGAIAPTLGAGDVVFMALLLGAAAVHGAPRARVVAALVLGVGASLALSSLLRAAVPALPAIGAATVALVPAFRDIRPGDRGAARLGIAVGLGMGLVAITRAALGA